MPLERMCQYRVGGALMFTHRKATNANHSRTQNGAWGNPRIAEAQLE